MSENIEEPGGSDAPTFDAAVRGAVGELGETLQRFQSLYETLPAESYADEEWTQIERAARDLEEMVSRGEDAYAAAEFDSQAWYRVMEQLQQVTRRLSEAVSLMERVRARMQPAS
jgi:hypothetical protein